MGVGFEDPMFETTHMTFHVPNAINKQGLTEPAIWAWRMATLLEMQVNDHALPLSAPHCVGTLW